MIKFEIIALTPAGHPDPSIAIAACRAGQLGILDLEYQRKTEDAISSVGRLVHFAKNNCGVKIDVVQARIFEQIVSQLSVYPKTIVLTTAFDNNSEKLKVFVEKIRGYGCHVIAEVTCDTQLHVVLGANVDGIIAKGNESGGRVGEETSFLLLQRIIKQSNVPVWVQGGIGMHTAAACRVAGACGVVLDAQLLLSRESTLPDSVKDRIRKMDGGQTRCVGGDLGATIRVYHRPMLAIMDKLDDIEREILQQSPSTKARKAEWIAHIHNMIGWNDPDAQLMPMGPDARYAAQLADRYVTTAGIIDAFSKTVETHIQGARIACPMKPDSSLARSHQTRYPIVQGPMSHVSDRAEFLAKVADAGALPFLAMGFSNADELAPVFEKTRQRLKDRPWGVGFIGFLPEKLRHQQMALVEQFRPPFALVAGGQPEHVQQFENKGIVAYLHVPTGTLLKMFLHQGVRRLIFEGRECGGHIGPLTSFSLWNEAVDVILDFLESNGNTELHVLFAGGIHDAISSAMVATLAQPLVAKGVKIGVIMGSAYLFTKEAVSAGAIVKRYQKEAIQCKHTCELETGPGHSVRCAVTPFADAFRQEKQALRRRHAPLQDAREILEKLNLGRLRIAAKGITRNSKREGKGRTPSFIHLKEERQYQQGNYMIGQLAALRDQTVTIKDLHHQVSVESTRYLVEKIKELDKALPIQSDQKPSDVAIIGMACLLPKAPDLQTYWENILNKVDAISEVPEDRWDWRAYYDPDPKKRDKVYSKWGGFLDAVSFDPMQYGMPPNSLTSIEPLQLLTLETVSAALEDAGYADRPFPRERTSVIFGVGGGVADLGQQYVFRANIPMFYKNASAEVMDQFPEWTEDSFPGILLNITAGRVANRFNLGGANYTVDAACASSLAAIYLAVSELETGASDMIIVGGGDTSQNPFAYLCFSKTHALSPTGRCRTFDESADGTVISEGVASMVLKRLADAERDGDRIYAVIKGVGASSDGRDKGLTAPRPEGQKRALDRAYSKAGFSPASVALIEAHGTGTVAGDQAEIETLKLAFETAGTPQQPCALGSVKSMIGHTKCVAGIAGLIKITQALYHKVLPPTMGVTKPNRSLSESPLYVNTESRPWIKGNGRPRRAGVSGFGFGGSNFHAVLEEYTNDFLETAQKAVSWQWSSEIFLFTGQSHHELFAAISSIDKVLAEGATPALPDLAYTLWQEAKKRSGLRLAVVAASIDDLRAKLARIRDKLGNAEDSAPVRMFDPKGVYFTEKPLYGPGSVAFLFPGQGSQYPDMLIDLAIHFREVRKPFEVADSVLSDQFPQSLSDYVFPPPCFNEEGRKNNRDALTQTNVAQPAIGAANMGLLQLLQAFGVRPHMVAGHSYGEFTALCAASVIAEDELYRLSEKRGRLITEAAGRDLGIMAAVEAPPEHLCKILDPIEGVWLANLNAPRQTIISGTQDGVKEALQCLQAQGIRTTAIPVSCAFHSPLMRPVQQALAEYLNTVGFAVPELKVFSNTLAAIYPQDPTAIRALLCEHLVRPVKFSEQIEAMYQAGARIFIEVGPRNVLTGLTEQILDGRPSLTVALDMPGRSGLLQLQHALGQLVTCGVPIQLDRLYQGRGVRQLNLKTLVDETKDRSVSPTTWMVQGGKVWPLTARMTPSGGVPSGNDFTLTEKKESHEKTSQRATRSKSVDTSSALPQSENGHQTIETLANRPDHSEAGQVMLRYQQMMHRFLEAQQQVMLAFLRGDTHGETANPFDDSELTNHLRSLTVPPGSPSVDELKLDTLQPAQGTDGRQPEASFKETSTPVVSLGNQVHAETIPVEMSAPESRAEELKAYILSTVSDRTGYPVDMLDLNADLEADLGIDSIKRVEILGTIQKTYLSANQALGQEAMDGLTGLKTLQGIIDWFSEALGDQSEEPVHDEAVIPQQEALALSRTEDLKGYILSTVSDRTGYPVDMLDLNADLEADLGIDSIKRVEILGTIQKTYLSANQALGQEAMDGLTGLKTLQGIIDWFSEALGTQSEEPVHDEAVIPQQEALALPASGETSEANEIELPRFLLSAVDAPSLIDTPLQIPLDMVLVITDDERGIGQFLADELRRLGGRVALVRMGDQVGEKDQGLYTSDLTDLDSVSRLVALVRQRQGDLCGIIHLLPLRGGSSFEEMGFKAWQERLQLESKSLFYLAKTAAKNLKNAAKSGLGWVIGATAMGGRFAVDMDDLPPFFPGQGAVVGLVKTLAVEWPDVRCKSVDLNLELTPEKSADHILREMASVDGEVEVGYRGSHRIFLRSARTLLQERDPVTLDIGSNWVVVVTGGARGITAEVAHELAERYRPILILAGRSDFPEGPEEADTAGLLSSQDLKSALIEKMRRADKNVRPAQIDAAYTRLCQNREMRSNLSAMKQSGAEVHYIQVDVCDEHACSQFIDHVYKRFGRLDLFIHGAGVIEDKLIEDKTADAFDRVFDTKAISAYIICQKLHAESLRGLVFFSSVAGRFGNRGQIDYVASNEVVNKLAVLLDSRWPGRVVAINWGPWAKSGMVSQEVQRQFLDRGVQPIQPTAGRQSLDKELRYGRKGQVEVLIGNGPWETVEDRSVRELHIRLPMLHGALLKSGNNGAFRVIRTLDPTVEKYLQDHRLDGKPVFPAAMAAELMAEVVQQGWPCCEVTGINDLKVLKGIVLEGRAQEIQIVAQPKATLSAGEAQQEVYVEIGLVGQIDHPSYRATVVTGKGVSPPPALDPGVFSKLNPFSMTVDEAYERWLFHGPSLQGISKIEGINEAGISAVLQPSVPGQCLGNNGNGQWMIDPVILDSAFQLAILWERAHFDMTPLPSGFSAYYRFHPSPRFPLRCYVQTKSSVDGLILSTNIHFLGEDGQMIAFLEEMQFSCTKALNRLAGTVESSRGNGK